jgi:hypothetical protein
MPQLRTKLSERREIIRARKAVQKAERIINSLTLEEKANLERRAIGKTAHEFSIELARDMAASQVREKMIKDDVGIPTDMIEAVTGDTVEDILSEMVEGDSILDDAETHQAFRKMLDDLREMVGKFESHQANQKTLTYSELINYPTPADLPPLAMTGQLDFGTGVRLLHIRNFGSYLEKAGIDPEAGRNEDGSPSAEVDVCWQLSAFDTIVETLAQGSCSVAQVAEAMGIDQHLVTYAWEAHKTGANVTELRPTCRVTPG